MEKDIAKKKIENRNIIPVVIFSDISITPPDPCLVSIGEHKLPVKKIAHFAMAFSSKM
jgi:hypothetical protein